MLEHTEVSQVKNLLIVFLIITNILIYTYFITKFTLALYFKGFTIRINKLFENSYRYYNNNFASLNNFINIVNKLNILN